MISMISAVGKNYEIGKDNKLIWRIPQDMKFFKNVTMGHVVVMGRKTFESLPGELPGRKMIVLSSKNIDGEVETVKDISLIIDRYLNSSEEIFIIGGESIYRQFIDYASNLYLTEIDDECQEADTFFPKIDKNKWDKEILDEGSYNDVDYQMCRYVRRNIL